MKKCAVCGSIFDDKNLFCGNCGNRLGDPVAEEVADITTETADAEEVPAEAEKAEETPVIPEVSEEVPTEEVPAEEPEEAEEAEEASTEETEETEDPAQRVLKSEPHIYGQAEGSAPAGQEFQQGMIRRNVQGRPGAPAPQPAYQMNPSLQARPVNGPQGRPMGPMDPHNRPVMPPRPMMQSPNQVAAQIRDTAKKAMRSPLFFLVALFNTACFAGAIGTVLMNQLNYSQAARMIQEFDLPAQVAGYANTATTALSSLDKGMMGVNFALLIPNLLLCLGLWVIFFSAVAAKNKDTLAGGGFTLVKAYIIIHMIAACIIMLACLVLSVAVVIASWMADSKSAMIIAIIVLVLLIVLVMMIIMYYVSYVGTWNVCHVNGNSGDIYGKVSGYVAAIHIIMALFGIIGLLSGIVNNEIATIVKAAGMIGWNFFLAIWIFRYKAKLSVFQEA